MLFVSLCCCRIGNLVIAISNKEREITIVLMLGPVSSGRTLVS